MFRLNGDFTSRRLAQNVLSQKPCDLLMSSENTMVAVMWFERQTMGLFLLFWSKRLTIVDARLETSSGFCRCIWNPLLSERLRSSSAAYPDRAIAGSLSG